jgi:hypothetical protein
MATENLSLERAAGIRRAVKFKYRKWRRNPKANFHIPSGRRARWTWAMILCGSMEFPPRR